MNLQINYIYIYFSDEQGLKILAVEPATYKYLMEKNDKGNSEEIEHNNPTSSEVTNISKCNKNNLRLNTISTK